MEPLTVTFLLEHDQDALYQTRDHLRELLAAGGVPDERELATWMEAKFSRSWRDFDFAPYGLRDEQWQELAESCLADTLEVIAYEQAHALEVKP